VDAQRGVRLELESAATQSSTAAEAMIPDMCLFSIARSVMPDDLSATGDRRRQVEGERDRQSRQRIHGARFHLACHSVGARQSTTSHSTARIASLSMTHPVAERVSRAPGDPCRARRGNGQRVGIGLLKDEAGHELSFLLVLAAVPAAAEEPPDRRVAEGRQQLRGEAGQAASVPGSVKASLSSPKSTMISRRPPRAST